MTWCHLTKMSRQLFCNPEIFARELPELSLGGPRNKISHLKLGEVARREAVHFVVAHVLEADRVVDRLLILVRI